MKAHPSFPLVPMNEMDLQQLHRRIPRQLADALRCCTYPTILAGGALRSVVLGEPVNDWDLFVSSDAHADELRRAILCAYGHEKRVVITENAITICTSPAVQIITRWKFETLEDAVRSFDFTIAQAAVTLKSDGTFTGACVHSYYADLAAKRLIYTAPIRDEEPGGSMLRLLRFTARGYRATLHTVAAVIDRLYSGVDHDKAPTPELRVAVLRGLLHNVDPRSTWDESRVIDEDEDEDTQPTAATTIDDLEQAGPEGT